MSAQHISLSRIKRISGSLDCVVAHRIAIQGRLMKKLGKTNKTSTRRSEETQISDLVAKCLLIECK